MKKLHKTKYKLPILMVLLLVVPLAATSWFSYQKSEILERAIIQKDDIIEVSPKYEKTFDEYEEFLTGLVETEELQYEKVTPNGDSDTNYPNMPNVNDQALTNYYQSFLSEKAHGKAFIINLYIGTTEGALYLNNIPESNVDLNNYRSTSTDWYNQAINRNGEVIWTMPYIDTASGKPTITLAKAYTNDLGETIGVAAIDFDMYMIATMMRKDILHSTIITMIISIVIGLVLVLLFVRGFNRNIANMKMELTKLANGDLSGPPMKVKGKDEFAELLITVNQLKDSLYDMINQLMIATARVMQQNTTLRNASDQVKEGTEQIAATMEELSSGSESQASNASDLTAVMERFNEKVSESTQFGRDLALQSDDVLTLSNDGKQQLDQSVEQMNEMKERVRNATNKVLGLNQQTNEIDKIVLVIKEIAEQTNLLALNAAIESARAGEAGKGFAVVANEVRKLAEQVSNSISGITDIVNKIQDESTEVTASLQLSFEEVEKSSEQIMVTGKSFETINHSINTMAEKIHSIVGQLQQINENSMDMYRSVDEIAAVSEESAAAVQQTAASAEDMNHTMESVTKSVGEMEELSADLEKHVEKFKIT
ncbi:methyl-accepting chemotaxis protein [Gracilibacillus xinjiangensis]|uniref:Methyl-accepting chemotaxis protein n=1 Tax=Gracilibacillus xinjiangensis TaxID=1193282 RepID=A0ABV8WWF5_9BACI